jgi:tRNA dimethylallyltransferase
MSEAAAPILIAGPTASGKSAVALRLAEVLGGVVINADAMQVYREIPILSARPTAADAARAPHRLYGHIAAADAYSVGRYVIDAAAALQRAQAEGQRPIIVGGTGLYFKALLEGLSPIPEIPADVRRRWRDEAQRIGAVALHAILGDRDPIMAERLASGDTQRLTRALEVLDGTGRSLAHWQQQAGVPVLPGGPVVRLVLRPEIDWLKARCDQRFDVMIASGALAEVAALDALGLDTALPAFGALGVAPLRAHLRGEMDLDAAITRAKSDTLRYVKRQRTWLKRNMIAWNDVQNSLINQTNRSIIEFIEKSASAR